MDQGGDNGQFWELFPPLDNGHVIMDTLYISLAQCVSHQCVPGSSRGQVSLKKVISTPERHCLHAAATLQGVR